MFRSIWISLTSLVVIAGIILGVFFGVAYCPAKNNIQYDEIAATKIALEAVKNDEATLGANPIIKKTEREFELSFPSISSSYFKYEIVILTDIMKLEVEVNAETGVASTHIKDSDEIRSSATSQR